MVEAFRTAYLDTYKRIRRIAVFEVLRIAALDSYRVGIRRFYATGPLCFDALVGKDRAACSIDDLQAVAPEDPSVVAHPGFARLKEALEAHWRTLVSDNPAAKVRNSCPTEGDPWGEPWQLLRLPDEKAICGLDLGRTPEGRMVLRFTELNTNTGRSVTNAIEDLATIALQHLHLTLPQTRIVEHYPRTDRRRSATHDEVTFDLDGQKPVDPVWRRMTEEEWRQLALSCERRRT